MKLPYRLLKDTVSARRFVLATTGLILLTLFYFRYHIYVHFLHAYQLTTQADVDSNVYNDHTMDSIVNQTVPRKFVIMSVSMVDKRNFYYVLYLPICALAWRRMGYEPLVFIVKDKNDPLNELTSKPVEYLNMFNVKVMFVDAPPQYIKHVAMLVRLFVGILPDEVARDQDLIMTSDTDFVPISKQYFNFVNTNAITLLDARNRKFKYKGKPYEMPEVLIPYIGMRKWQWRRVMRLERGMPINGATVIDKVKEIHGANSFAENTQMKRGDEFWFLDQRTITIAINEYVKSGESGAKVNRYPYVGLRLNRGWPQLWNVMLERFDEITDSHLYHVDSFEYQEYTFALLRKLFSRSIVLTLEKYFQEFKKIALN
jgi:hypothetical protein